MNFKEDELCGYLKEGFPPALNYFFKKYRPWLTVVATTVVHDEDEAKDIVQDFYVDCIEGKVFQTMDADDHASMKSYVYRGIRNRSLNYLTKNIIRRRYEAQAEVYPYLESRMDFALFREYLQEVMNQLSPMQAAVVRLTYLDDLSRKDIAEKLSISEHTVKNHLLAGTKCLREILSHHGFGRP